MRVLTIGVYGFTEEGFIAALQGANIDVFVDVRRRRGVRGPLYPFANAKRLQEILARLGIRYVHRLELAPSAEIIALQGKVDHDAHVRHRDRATLSREFVAVYTEQMLSHLNPHALMEDLGDPDTVLFFCVERVPEACHRSLLADAVATELGATVEHLVPDSS
jgi:uncharacterized protein (DUF488 family)